MILIKKPDLLRHAIIGVLAGTALCAHADVYFSEYIEGSSNNKALEIYNSGDTAIKLSGYKIEQYSNGNTTPTTSVTVNLTGSIPAKGTFVIAPTNANATIQAKANQLFGTGWFNGNDAIERS